jgi:OOP family OmpA-OmpF porin
MKQKLLAIVALFTGVIGFAQYEGYNTWSIEANAGVTNFNDLLVGSGHILSPGYFSNGFGEAIPGAKNPGFGFSPLHVNLGVRKMLSPGMGFKATLFYTNIKNDQSSRPFEATYIGGDIQMYLNLNQLANASLWNRVNFLVHAGPGFANFSLNERFVVSQFGRDNTDYVFSANIGATAQVRITNRLALNFDLSNSWFLKHQMMVDGSEAVKSLGGFDASVMNLTGGLTYYLGKNAKHTDWYERPAPEVKEETKEAKDYGPELMELQNRIKALEARPAGDVNSLQNKIRDLENQIKNLNTSTKQMMDANIIHAYFDFDKDQPTASSQKDIQTAIDYLKNNPTATMGLVGHADKIGTVAYNEDLSKRRVDNVKNMMVQAGIDASRITTSWKGSRGASHADSDQRALERKVVFRVN